ncbi:MULTISPECIES: flagellar basal body rod protein FlgB [Pseudoalteromonas]|uniref:Flagellar basal body rod protein FlgB n=1 Tax=Pseudoalteromonas ruthenica TaxID=151081 RepID=A0A0F4PSF7_9GAMM|nr:MULTISPECIES: flagellar basal body rod protein FlgB [Pseudoalteromonas]KJY97206.1 flagellar basal body rod protein FlgB [Pseudoalteromonas ruthenica]KJY99519.1 flagellar basal body rod protein FlgB [Pseudoalteromonas ruthenica]MCF2863440.1 flagellar basal body rod protein FlgB [Pseudoalteromonas sp. CNAT2-18]MCG7544884.1 flagellar basal body rod protein FlgB [Pseudoalteromonas sp. MM17-2]MCG7558393.1 flagellar basal body rod protein FlgB [Pseudoalteromonas sp. CNAT2-18.1]|tara:strand:- start:11105 stop:11515 length:411 start_codon:yes stop_codon:yes gene_type:complete
MAISFDKAFGIHPQAMLVRSQRAELLASNIANADTPGYKAKDIDFASALKAANNRQLSGNSLARTHPEHLQASTQMSMGEAKFRVPNQPDTGDGNSVDVQVERNLYTQNAIEYQASLRFMNGKISGLKKALGGQGA